MITARLRRILSPWAFLIVLLPSVALAQTGAASITGLVTDETGAAVPGVTVTATNQATNVPYVAASNEARQLHDHVGAGWHLRRQGGAHRVPHDHDEPPSRSRRSRSHGSTSR